MIKAIILSLASMQLLMAEPIVIEPDGNTETSIGTEGSATIDSSTTETNTTDTTTTTETTTTRVTKSTTSKTTVIEIAPSAYSFVHDAKKTENYSFKPSNHMALIHLSANSSSVYLNSDSMIKLYIGSDLRKNKLLVGSNLYNGVFSVSPYAVDFSNFYEIANKKAGSVRVSGNTLVFD